MADHLASIYGTEKDKVNCSFYFKIGACRHGETCSRKHVKPLYSQTVLIGNIYQNPALDPTSTLKEKQVQAHFDNFYEDMFCELANFGEIEELVACDNVGEHLVGNVYVMFKYEKDAQKCVDSLNERFYAGRPVYCELSPVTDFGEACCRQYENNECTRAGFCNFMHLKDVTRTLRKELFEGQKLSIRMKAEAEGRTIEEVDDRRDYSVRKDRDRGSRRDDRRDDRRGFDRRENFRDDRRDVYRYDDRRPRDDRREERYDRRGYDHYDSRRDYDDRRRRDDYRRR